MTLQPSGAPLLSVKDINVTFGAIVALDSVSFDVEAGQICGIIGPNGAGKTTLFNVLSRLYRPGRGSITFDGHALLKLAPHRIVEVGIARTFQNIALFPAMSVLENVLVGAHSLGRTGYLANLFRTPAVGLEQKRQTDAAMHLIETLGLADLAHSDVGALPFGTRKRVELARALVSRPKLLLLDEPAGGLNHSEVDDLGELIKDLRDRLNVTILLVEHHLNLVMRVSDKVVAVDFGRVIADDIPAKVQANPDVIRAYLGTEDA
jgi:branched-chain amino acid transport system ATP-binding protein